MIVVDASAIIALLAGESDAEALAQRLAIDHQRAVSTVSVWEAACAIASWKGCSRPAGQIIMKDFMSDAAITAIAPDMVITALAVEAADRYGRGGGRPGILNLGDCFSYATAKHLGAALLFKGDDFGRTDIIAA